MSFLAQIKSRRSVGGRLSDSISPPTAMQQQQQQQQQQHPAIVSITQFRSSLGNCNPSYPSKATSSSIAPHHAVYYSNGHAAAPSTTPVLPEITAPPRRVSHMAQSNSTSNNEGPTLLASSEKLIKKGGPGGGGTSFHPTYPVTNKSVATTSVGPRPTREPGCGPDGKLGLRGPGFRPNPGKTKHRISTGNESIEGACPPPSLFPTLKLLVQLL